MLISFELSMPGNNAWNGRWSGEGTCYAIVKSFRKMPATFKLGSYGYSFGDGWCANVTVREITKPAADKLRKQSKGFNGYDWMVDEITTLGRIRTLQERTQPRHSTEQATEQS